MNDNYRLIKLISLVGWAHPTENTCGLRFASDAARDRLTDHERTVGHMMCAHYAGAVEYHQGNTDFDHKLDRERLPDFALEFVTNLSDDAIAVLGETAARTGQPRRSIRRDDVTRSSLDDP